MTKIQETRKETATNQGAQKEIKKKLKENIVGASAETYPMLNAGLDGNKNTGNKKKTATNQGVDEIRKKFNMENIVGAIAEAYPMPNAGLNWAN